MDFECLPSMRGVTRLCKVKVQKLCDELGAGGKMDTREGSKVFRHVVCTKEERFIKISICMSRMWGVEGIEAAIA